MHGEYSAHETILVVRGLQTNPLSLQAIIALQLAYRVNATSVEEHGVVKQFPKVFKGLRKTGEDCQIKHTHMHSVPHNVPIPLGLTHQPPGVRGW